MKSCILTCILLLVIVGIECKCPNYCVCDNTSIKCNKRFPTIIPENISSVTLFELRQKVVLNFSSAGWENITHLSLGIGAGYFTIRKQSYRLITANGFSRLKNLEYLQLHCYCYFSIEKNAFHGLTNVKVLDLSNNNVWSLQTDIAPGLYGDDTLPNLSELYLSNVSADPHQVFDLSILHASAKCVRFLKVLDVSDTLVTINYWPNQTLFEHLQVLNVSRSGDAFGLFTQLSQNGNIRRKIFINLQVLDASYAYFSQSISACKLDFIYEMFCSGKHANSLVHIFLPLNQTELYVKNLFNSPIQLKGTVNATTLCILASYFNINITMCISERFNHLMKLDISNNSITYIEPDLVRPLVGLKHLDLSRNDLGKVISFGNYASSFFHALQHIKVLIMSYNNIIAIPKDAVTNNSYLEVLDLSHNKLEALDFGLDFLDSLQHLDISFNNILYLDPISCTLLSDLTFKENNASNYYRATSQNTIIGTYINFKGNLISCSCDSTCLLNYIVRLNETYTCLLNDQLEVISDLTIRKTVYLCKEGIVIGTFSTLAVALVIICAVGTYLVIQEKRRITLKRLKETGIEMYTMSQNKRIVFLSFAGEDEDIVMTEVYPKLDSGLKAILNTDECCVATGATDFRLGYYIKNEIVRCIEASSVVVLFLSDNFCRKSWCRDEVYKAFGEDKPIIMMMWGKVDTDIMPNVLRKHYERNTRVHLIIEDGKLVMRPGWNRVCEDIVKLIGRNQ